MTSSQKAEDLALAKRFDLNQWLTDFGIPLADPYHGMLMRFSHEELEALVDAAQAEARLEQAERDAQLADDIRKEAAGEDLGIPDAIRAAAKEQQG